MAAPPPGSESLIIYAHIFPETHTLQASLTLRLSLLLLLLPPFSLALLPASFSHLLRVIDFIQVMRLSSLMCTAYDGGLGVVGKGKFISYTQLVAPRRLEWLRNILSKWSFHYVWHFLPRIAKIYSKTYPGNHQTQSCKTLKPKINFPAVNRTQKKYIA